MLNPLTKFYPDNDNRPSLPRFQTDGMTANWPLVTALYEFGHQRGLTGAQVALSWLLAQKPWIVPISGTTKQAHLQENLWAADFEFIGDEHSVLTENINKIKIVGDRYNSQPAR